MIVKFLAKSRTFKGVRYNTNKVEKDKGELMKVSGFGPLQSFSQLMPVDYINYLQMLSSRNKRVVYPQLHTVISAKGKDTSKEELTEIAEKWLRQMGYADQPYLIIFHKDTRNHHVHIVSTRIDKTTGKKISSAFEKIRALTAINRIMKQDEKQVAKADLEKAFKYNFQTKAQFMLILESKGYALAERDGKLSMIRYGKKLLDVDLAFLKDRKVGYTINQARANQITAYIHRYKQQYSPALRPFTQPAAGGIQLLKQGCTSDLAEQLHKMFGIQLIFHGKPGMAPYGYTILDHANENVFKGGEIMDKVELLAESLKASEIIPGSEEHHLKKVSVSDSPPRLSGSSDQELDESLTTLVSTSSPQFDIYDKFEPFESALRIDISDDIDDEAIHGRNRHRKRQVRTNTR